MAKVIEVIAESDKSWDAAAENAVKEASKSIRDIKHLYVQDMQATLQFPSPAGALPAAIFLVPDRGARLVYGLNIWSLPSSLSCSWCSPRRAVTIC